MAVSVDDGVPTTQLALLVLRNTRFSAAPVKLPSALAAAEKSPVTTKVVFAPMRSASVIGAPLGSFGVGTPRP